MKKLIKKLKANDNVVRLFYYFVLGIGTSAISIISYIWLLIMNVQYIVAASISWILTITFSYASNRKVVFLSNAKGIKEVSKEYFKFALGRFSTYLFNMVALTYFVEHFNFDPFYSNIVINIVVLVLNYFLSKIAIKNSSDAVY